MNIKSSLFLTMMLLVACAAKAPVPAEERVGTASCECTLNGVQMDMRDKMLVAKNLIENMNGAIGECKKAGLLEPFPFEMTTQDWWTTDGCVCKNLPLNQAEFYIMLKNRFRLSLEALIICEERAWAPPEPQKWEVRTEL